MNSRAMPCVLCHYHHPLKLLAEYPDLIGIYNVGGASYGVREKGRERDVIFIGHGLTLDTRSFLLEDIMDLVITQSPDSIVQNTLKIFENVRAGKAPLSGVSKLGMELVFKENLP